MGTPHRGAWSATLASQTLKIFGMIKSTNKNLLQVLQTNDSQLRELNQDFLQLLRRLRETGPGGKKINVQCFYEDRPMRNVGFIGQIVDKDSATFDSDLPIAINSDHSEMVKFESVADPGFQQVAGVLRRWTVALR